MNKRISVKLRDTVYELKDSGIYIFNNTERKLSFATINDGNIYLIFRDTGWQIDQNHFDTDFFR
jgi:hypothetical protein